ncbi:hypothetical protein LEP1GSC199_3452 [Leptospira vanthielii serovar Holland str. Waz Holland = ATCC 700522]|uniref:Uncharacterized protein n=1 Tax=Leptospira vanthielii serovar Holland str. Waz Holland = ATCC 700522 TaxID=1218591 RepID=N1W6S2_9LEPT|nr:hypothetical protein LEP1GSC199_3452 [Leptospira vanthielii serovar Holland str. Waz Holland = ATCC 700522]
MVKKRPLKKSKKKEDRKISYESSYMWFDKSDPRIMKYDSICFC